MPVNRPAEGELPDLEYCCRFIGTSGVIEGLRLFSSSDDAAAEQEALEQLRQRSGSGCVELWKNDRLVARYSAAP